MEIRTADQKYYLGIEQKEFNGINISVEQKGSYVTGCFPQPI